MKSTKEIASTDSKPEKDDKLEEPQDHFYGKYAQPA